MSKLIYGVPFGSFKLPFCVACFRAVVMFAEAFFGTAFVVAVFLVVAALFVAVVLFVLFFFFAIGIALAMGCGDVLYSRWSSKTRPKRETVITMGFLYLAIWWRLR